MNPPAFRFRPINAQYEGEFADTDVRFLATCSHDKADNLADLLGADAPKIRTVLEVGCGTGIVLLRLAERGIGSDHRGVDFADPHEHTDPAVTASGLHLDQYDGSRLPYDDASFDLVYATHVLEHVLDEQAFLAELRRVAKRFVYVEVPCEITVRTSVASLQVTLDIGHLHPYTPESFGLELARGRLSPLRFRLFDHSIAVHSFYVGKLRGWFKMTLRRIALRLSPALASKVFCYHVGALCAVD